ncbi:EAL domain-containing protein [Thiolapillus sp.]
MSERRRTDWGLRLIIGSVLLCLVLLFTWRGWLSNLDNLIYDSFIRQMDIPVLEDVVIVAIDPKSLSSLGRWPFPRSYHVDLLQALMQGQPAVIAMDINFAEPDLQHPDDDIRLVRAVRESGLVVLPVVLEQYSAEPGLRESLPMFALHQAAAALGHVDTELDADGIARSAFLMAGLDRPRWPALPLAMAQVGGGWPAAKPLPKSGQTPVYTKTVSGVWRRHHQVLVPFPSSSEDLAVVSYVDVVSGAVPESRFHNKYVLVGATASGLGDNIPTPISASGRPVAGVEFNAYVLNALLQNKLIVPASLNQQYLFNALLVVLMVLWYRPRGWGYVYGIPLLSFVVLGVAYLLLSRLQYWYPPGVMLLSIVLFFLIANGHQLRRLLQALFEERQLSQTALTAIGDAVVHLDEQGRIRKCNPMAEKLSGVEAGKAEGRPVDEVFRLTHNASGHRFSLREYLRHRQPLFDHILALKNARGEEYQVHMALSTVPGAEGGAQTSVMVLTDVSKEYALANAVTHRETHNILTDLPNQDLIVKHLESALHRAAKSHMQVAVIDFDIDHFSRINEVRGIDTGNQLLQAVAYKLHTLLGGQVEIGHIGADEFLLILEEGKIDRPIEEMVELVFTLFSRPLQVMGQEMRISLTLGVSIYPAHGDNPALLIGCAGTAMHRGKKEGGGRIAYYAAGMQDKASRLLEIESLLHQALESGGFEVFYQPLIQASSLKIIGVEALARLRDTNNLYVSPDEFIEVAERVGLIAEMGYQQLHRACAQLQQWRKLGFVLRLSYNFSPRQMGSIDLIERIRQILGDTGFDPRMLDFEVTENLLLSDDQLAETVLRQIQAMGIGLVIDDFGTGYSAMSYLTRFHFDRLKIDKSFVSNLDSSSGSRAITSAIITMAHDLEMEVVAEGVETAEQYELLLSQECDEVQGYFLGKPMPAQEIREYLFANKGYAPLAS